MTSTAPVANRGNGGKFLLAAQAGEAVMDRLPDAGHLGVDLAPATDRTTTRSIHQALGAAGHRAEPASQMQDAIAAAGALFGPLPLFYRTAHAGGVDARIDPGHGPQIGDKIDADPAGHGDNGVILTIPLIQAIDVLLVALSHQGADDGRQLLPRLLTAQSQ